MALKSLVAALLLLLVVVNGAENYTNPVLSRIITFDEAADCHQPDRNVEESMHEHLRATRNVGIRDKIYDMLQHGIPLTEEEKDQALEEYSYWYPEALRPTARQVLSGNLKNMHPPGLRLISWLTGVEYDRLHAVQHFPETLDNMRHIRSLHDKRDSTTQLDLNQQVNGYYGNGTETSTAFGDELNTYSGAGEKAETPLGLYFSNESAIVIAYAFTDAPDKGGVRAINATIGTLSKPFKVRIQGGFDSEFAVEVEGEPMSLSITAFGDWQCTQNLGSVYYTLAKVPGSNVTVTDKNETVSSGGVWLKLAFIGRAYCLTFSSSKETNLVMDSFTFGKLLTASVYFNETTLYKDTSLATTPQDLPTFYGENTIPETYAFSVTRLGLYLGSMLTFKTNHVVVNGSTFQALYTHRGFNGLVVLVANATYGNVNGTMLLYPEPTCGGEPVSYNFSLNATTALQAITAGDVNSPAIHKCLYIQLFDDTGAFDVYALFVNTTLPVPPTKPPTTTASSTTSKATSSSTSAATSATSGSSPTTSKSSSTATASASTATSGSATNSPTSSESTTGAQNTSDAAKIALSMLAVLLCLISL